MIKVLFLLLFVFSEGLCKQIRSIERPDVVIKEDIESGLFWKHMLQKLTYIIQNHCKTHGHILWPNFVLEQ